MGLTAVVPSASEGVVPTLPVGTTEGSIFIAVATIVFFAYIHLFDTFEQNDKQLRAMLIATIIPLSITFAAFVLLTSLTLV